MQNSLPTTNIFNGVYQNEAESKVPGCSRAALPLEIQRAEKALRLDHLFEYVRNFQKQQREQKKKLPENHQCLNYVSDPEGNHFFNGVAVTKKERRTDKKRLYNVDLLTNSRQWLEEVLLTDSSESECEDVTAEGAGTTKTEKIDNYVKSMLKEHAYAKRCRKKFSKLPPATQQKYACYSTNLILCPQQISDFKRAPRLDSPTPTKPPAKQKKAGKLSEAAEKNSVKATKVKVEKDVDCIKQETPYLDFFKKEENTSDDYGDDDDGDGLCGKTSATPSRRYNFQSSNGNGDNVDSELSRCSVDRSKPKPKKQANAEQMANRRKKLWIAIAKKDIPRTSKHKLLLRKDNLASLKKVARECQRECRRMALASQKQSKEAATRARRLFKEMQAYWKRFEKVEKEHRKKAEKEAMEQKKIDMEMKEMLRQQRKLNFLIAQTELYAHFMAGKLSGGGNDEDGTDTNPSLEPGCEEILSRFDEDKPLVKRVLSSSINGQQLVIRKKDDDDDYDSQRMKDLVLNNVRNAIEMQRNKVREFDMNERAGIDGIADSAFSDPSINKVGEWKQPSIFMGTLKSYQLKGMNWLANLYDQGINGILADEMGLGKTVQSVAFLAHLAEEQGIWGPFLVVAPASTLHNWLQEMTKFVPDFKVIPYWGTTQDRKVLRKFWNRSSSKNFPDITSKDSSFHVVITSYQMVVQDAKYFQQVNWHYMVLDEAQAIKSSNSSRWKSLLVFKCRNRLLLTGTPIQNSMAELWALLHFIMPTLFDSHDEFNEWFSKDIESHVEKQSSLDANQLSRLHMILKPFMLRRVKKDVENELSDKIEIQVCCPLMRRQRLLYKAIKNKISIEEILQSSSLSVSVTNNLMNIVMQLRKVCNHPELFERREIRSPCFLRFQPFYLPKLLYREGVAEGSSIDRRHLLTERFNIFDQHCIHHSLFHESSGRDGTATDSCFSFSRFIDTSPDEMCSVVKGGPLARWLYHLKCIKSRRLLRQQRHLDSDMSSHRRSLTRFVVIDDLNYDPAMGVDDSDTLRGLCFVRSNGDFFAHSDHKIRFMKESDEHRKVRLKNSPPDTRGFSDDPGGPRWPFCSSPPPVCDTDRFLDDPDDDEDGYGTTCPSDLRRRPYVRTLVPTSLPAFLLCVSPRVTCQGMSNSYTCDRSAEWRRLRNLDSSFHGRLHDALNYGSPETREDLIKWKTQVPFSGIPQIGGLIGSTPKPLGYGRIYIPSKETMVSDAGKLTVLDNLLLKLKSEGHRVLIYSQMTKMIDILEEFLWHRRYTYMRLDGSSKISDRRDMVADFQSRSDIFIFLLSTRAGGLGINLTAADTVIFYDSDWNPTVDQQAMDRAHRLGQTKQVTVYRLVCKDTIEERILQRAKEKSEIQRMVISGGEFAPDILKPKEVVSLLLDNEEMARRLCQKQEQRRVRDDTRRELTSLLDCKKRPKSKSGRGPGRPPKRLCLEAAANNPRDGTPQPPVFGLDDSSTVSDGSLSRPPSPKGRTLTAATANSENATDDDNSSSLFIDDQDSQQSSTGMPKIKVPRKRGRPKGTSNSAHTSSSSSNNPSGLATSRPRGRGSIQKSLSAAEAAALTAAKQAAFAAHGYTYSAEKLPSTMS